MRLFDMVIISRGSIASSKKKSSRKEEEKTFDAFYCGFARNGQAAQKLERLEPEPSSFELKAQTCP